MGGSYFLNFYPMKKGTNINFFISAELAAKVDKAIDTWGFGSRAEFFRFCAIEFLRFDTEAMASDEALREYSRRVAGVRFAKDMAKRHFNLGRVA